MAAARGPGAGAAAAGAARTDHPGHDRVRGESPGSISDSDEAGGDRPSTTGCAPTSSCGRARLPPNRSGDHRSSRIAPGEGAEGTGARRARPGTTPSRRLTVKPAPRTSRRSRSGRSRRLAALIERRLVTSTELTQMYLARLKRYQPTLNCYVTLTEELALAQAAEADREIRRAATGARCTACRGAPRISSPPKASGRPGARAVTTTRCPTRRDDRRAAARRRRRARRRSCRWARSRRATLVRRHDEQPVERRNAARADRRPDRARPPPPAWSAFAIGTETRGSIISPGGIGVVGLRPTTDASAGTARWRWLDDGQDRTDVPERRRLRAGAQRHLRPDGRDDTVVDAPFAGIRGRAAVEAAIGYVERSSTRRPAGAWARRGARGGRPGRRGGPWGRRREAGAHVRRAPAPAEDPDVLDVYARPARSWKPIELPDIPASRRTIGSSSPPKRRRRSTT